MKQKIAKKTPKTSEHGKPPKKLVPLQNNKDLAEDEDDAVKEEAVINTKKTKPVVQYKQILNGKLAKTTKKQKVREQVKDDQGEIVTTKKPKVVLKHEEDYETDKQEAAVESSSDDEEEKAECKVKKQEKKVKKVQSKDSTPETQNTSDCRIFVKNIKLGTKADQIKKYFQSCGEVRSVKMVDKYTTNFAFVNFTDKAAVPAAMKLHKTKLNGTTISVFANDPKRKLQKRDGKLTIKLNNKQNLPNLDPNKLKKIFAKCGEIDDVLVLCKKNTLAFITFKTEQAVQKAFELNGTTEQDIELEIAAYNKQKPNTTIYVKNINSAATEQDLKTLFSQAGQVSDIVLKKGCAVIAFKNSEAYCKSFMLNEVLLKKLPIFIEPYSIRKKTFTKKNKSSLFLMEKKLPGDSVFTSKSAEKNKKRPAEAANVNSIAAPKKAKTK